jgi:hypothetical protein
MDEKGALCARYFQDQKNVEQEIPEELVNSNIGRDAKYPEESLESDRRDWEVRQESHRRDWEARQESKQDKAYRGKQESTNELGK